MASVHTPSALSSYLESAIDKEAPKHPSYHAHLAAQVLHNLQFQHDWTALRLHTHSPNAPHNLLPRPLVSGTPSRRVYIHPDEQIELIKAGIKDEHAPAVREWVLPSHLAEKWSLRRFADVFDGISAYPPALEGEEVDHEAMANKDKWRRLKRLMLATVDDDSTVVYYIVHDGIVKPRQN